MPDNSQMNAQGFSENSRLRASDADRDQAATVINNAMAEGRLTPDEHSDRLDALYAAKTHADIVPLLDDLPGRATAAVPAAATALTPLYGQAAWLGESVPVHDSAHLLRSADLADRAARCLPAGEALLLRGNGALTLGRTPGLAVARMWLLSAACDACLSALAAGTVRPLTAAEIESWRAVADDLLPRLWQHLQRPDQGAVRTPRTSSG